MKIKITNQQDIKVSLSQLRDLIKYVLTKEGVKRTAVEISLLLVDNAKIKKLNRQYLGRQRATDVISFRMWEGPFYKLHPEILGDVVVSIEEAKRRTKKYPADFKKEIWLYVIHGLLHLLGYIDDTVENAKKMGRRCEFLLQGWMKIT